MDSWDKESDLKMLDAERPPLTTHTLKVLGHRIVQMGIDESQRPVYTCESRSECGGWLPGETWNFKFWSIQFYAPYRENREEDAQEGGESYCKWDANAWTYEYM